MDLSDVSGYTLYERKEHYRKQFGAYNVPPWERGEICKHADETARDEILQEIHTMLYHMTKGE